MQKPPLGNISPEVFLAEYWQKKPLLIRGAITAFDTQPTLANLCALATQDDVESRLVEKRNDQWRCESGPFKPSRFKKLAEQDWTLLVQSVNHHLPFCAELLYRFGFIPHVRLDDLMISHAPAGGGVGPHFDSYDVFLLQVGGRKQWQISSQSDLTLVEDAPLKILKHFTPEQEWVLEHGDMLYLPPRFAHNGVALEPGQTWSIGFRSPTTQELATQFLDFLRDRIDLPGIYTDPDLQATNQPARVPDAFIAQISNMLQAIRWDDTLVREFAGKYFSEPKAHVFYDGPDEPLTEKAFAKAVAKQGAALDLKTVMLFDDAHIYINGDLLEADGVAHATLRELANQRHLPPAAYAKPVLDALYACYEYGYLHPQVAATNDKS